MGPSEHPVENRSVLVSFFQAAQQAMGHANLATTELYLSTPTLDELAFRMRHVTLGTRPERVCSRSRRISLQTQ